MDRKKFQHEHHEFIHHLDRLHLMATATPDALPAERLSSLIEKEAAELLRGVGIHFAFEEEGGYMADVIGKRPELSPRVEAAHADHKKISSGLIALIRAAKTLEVAELQQQARELVDLVHAHEQREIDLLQEAFERDIGVGD